MSGSFRNITLNFIKGNKLNLKELVGSGKKAFVFEFWATWCPPCRNTIPHLTQLQHKFKNKDIIFIGITNENESVAKPFVDQQGDKMDYHVATDIAQSANTAFMQKYGAKGIPTAFIVDWTGNMKWHGHPQSPEFESELNALSNSKPAEKNTLNKDELTAKSVKELKSILASHHISDKGCVEKNDLVERILEHCS